MDKLDEQLGKAEELKKVCDNYYSEIQRLQNENATGKDLIASLDRKLKIKSIWNRIWRVLAALLAFLLALSHI